IIAIIDTQRGDYTNLAIAYNLARDIALNAKTLDLDKDLLSAIMNKIIKDLTDIVSIKDLVMTNIENNKKILGQLEKSVLSVDFSKKYLTKFLQTGTISKEDIFDFYSDK